MAILKSKEIKVMNKEDRGKRLKELKLELVKAKVAASKAGNSKVKEIRKIIARIHTFNNSDKEELKKK